MKFTWIKRALSLIVFTGIVTLQAQDVTVTIGSVNYPGYTADVGVPVILDNPNDYVSGIQFDLLADPNMINLTGVTTVGSANGFIADFNTLSDGSNRVIFYNATTNDSLPLSADTVMILHYDGSAIVSAVIDLLISNVLVSDPGGNALAATGVNGAIELGNVVSLSLSDTTGDANENVDLTVNMDNGGAVGGLQFDLFDFPDYVTVDSLWTTPRTTDFTISSTEIGSGTRILLYSTTNSNIAPGNGPILNIRYAINPDAYADDVVINFANVTVTDSIGGVYWIAGLDSGVVTVYPGYLEEPHNLEAISGLDAQVPLSWDAPYGPLPEEFSEDFEGGQIPDGWTMTTNSAIGWFVTQDGSSTYWTIPPHTWYACSNDDAADDDGSMDYLITPPLNTFGATAITLTFASFYDGSYSQTAHVEVSTDGVTFTEVYQLPPNADWVTETVDLSAYADQPSLYIAFHSNDNGAWASGWAIDDVVVTFTNTQVSRNVHFGFTPLGKWLITADKAKVIKRFPDGVPYAQKVDWQHPIEPEEVTPRDIPVSGYNIYRASDDDSTYTLLNSVGSDVTTYLDEGVVNGMTYYYYVTADYSPEGGESAPSNTASATPVEWVEVSISNGAALSGETDTLAVYLNNESDISFFYFEITDNPDYLTAEAILPTDRTSTWSLDVTEVGGTMVVTGLNLGTLLAPGSDAVCQVVVRAASQEEAILDLSFTSVAIQDANGNNMQSTTTSGTFEVSIETQTLAMPGGVGAAGATVILPLLINNTQDVHGVQVFFVDDPDYVSGVAVVPTNYIDFNNWTVQGNNVGNEFRVLMFDNTLQTPIPPGSGHIADIYFYIDSNAPSGSLIDLTMTNVVVVDVNNITMYTETIEGAIHVDNPAALFTISDVTGSNPGEVSTFTIGLENTVEVMYLQMAVVDLPDNLALVSVNGVDRFSGAIIDDATGEQDDGTGFIRAYGISSGIAPGSGPVLEVQVRAKANADTGRVLLLLNDINGVDANNNYIETMSGGYGFYDIFLGIEREPVIPESYALQQNYPNPFNPVTTIRYDLPEEVQVDLRIFDLMGREVRTLAHESQTPGQKTIVWDGTDNTGQKVSAGVYLYRLQAGTYLETRKMVFLK